MADSAKAKAALVIGIPVVTSNFRAFSGIAGREVIG
jgi:hypothetical protein